MSKKEKISDRIISKEETKKSISHRYDKNNNNINSEKRRIPLYNNPLYIKTEINQSENLNYLTQNFNKNIDLAYNQNNSKKNIYYKKNNFISPQRTNSERVLNNQFISNLSNTQQAFSTSRNNIKYKNYNRVNDFYNNNQKITINFLENNTINQTYTNKNKNKKNITHGKYSLSNKSFNNREDKILKSMTLSERNSIQRKSNYSYHYLTNNEANKNNNIQTKYQEKQYSNINRAIIKKRVNYLFIK